jgi:hypothetical protein
MINTKTVLVLGAGASKPYEFPTGKELVRQIRDFAGSRAEKWCESCNISLAGRRPADEEYLAHVVILMQSLHLELKECDPDSIDQFLELRPDMAEAGVLLISILLLSAEHESEEHLWSDTTGGHWYNYLKNRLVNLSKALGQNQLRVISFNYDRSLEHYLFRSLKPFYVGTLTDEAYVDAVKQTQFLHIYGSLGPLPWQSATGMVPYGAKGCGEILTAAKSIKVLHQGAEDAVQRNFIQAQEWLKWAHRVLFLGFGFHEDNVKRLTLANVLRPTQIISGTSYGLDHTRRSQVEFCTESAQRPDRLYPNIPGRPAILFPDDSVGCYDFLYQHADLS